MNTENRNSLVLGAACLIFGGILGVSIAFVAGDTPVNWIKADGRSDWLGFWGAIIGAAATIAAGGIAWLAAQRQILTSENINAVERLKNYDIQLRRLFRQLVEAIGDQEDGRPEARRERFRSLIESTSAPELIVLQNDTLLGGDGDAVGSWVMDLVAIAGYYTNPQWARNGPPDAFNPYFDIADSILKRIRLLESGTPVDKIRATTFIERRPLSF